MLPTAQKLLSSSGQNKTQAMGEFIKLLAPLLVIFYLVLFFLESLLPGFVSDNLNLNVFLLLALTVSLVVELPNLVTSLLLAKKHLSGRVVVLFLAPVLLYVSWLSYPTLLRLLKREANPNPTPILDVVAPEPLLPPIDWENKLSVGVPNGPLAILVLNGSNETGVASHFSKVLRDSGYDQVTVGDAPTHNYQGATIQFNAADENQALIIKDFLLLEYRPILAAPLGKTNDRIVIILGAKKPQ